MNEDDSVDFRHFARSPQFFTLRSFVSAIKLSCGYQPAFKMVFIVNAASRPVFRKLFFGKMAINLYSPGRRGSGLAHADSDMGL